MKKRKVIDQENLPSRIPASMILSGIIACDYWNAPDWLCGVLGVLAALVVIGVIHNMATNEKVKILDNDKRI